jgi:hypothetical protein
MGTKISALTTTGSAPTGAYIPIAYEGENYKISTETLRPRAYVAFDGTSADLTASITKSFNVDSITDNGVGSYQVTFTNDIDNPIINATCSTINSGIGEISTNNDDPQIGLKSSIIVATNRNGVSADAAYVAIIIF